MPMWNLDCLGAQMNCYLERLGLTAQVTFKRLDDTTSGGPNRFGERREEDKIYKTYVMNAVVDENPRKNVKGTTGAEVTEDVYFYLYSDVAKAGTQSGQTYRPVESDIAYYRGIDYDVTRIERIHPSGVDSQMAWRVMRKRHR